MWDPQQIEQGGRRGCHIYTEVELGMRLGD